MSDRRFVICEKHNSLKVLSMEYGGELVFQYGSLPIGFGNIELALLYKEKAKELFPTIHEFEIQEVDRYSTVDIYSRMSGSIIKR